MADFTALKTAIRNAIKQNGNEEITGDVLQQILLSMVSVMGDDAINALSAALSTAITSLTNDIGDVSSAVQSAVSGLNHSLNTEAQTRAYQDQQLQNGIYGEGAVRQAAISELNHRLNVEAQTRAYGDLNEASIRQNEDNRLELRINGLSLDFDDLLEDVRNLIRNYNPIVINGDVTNAPDEQDLTTTQNNLLKFKDNPYNPIVFSGMGKKFLRKNLRPLSASYDFDGFVDDVTTQSELSDYPERIFWDRINEYFVGLKNGVYYLAWADDDAYVPVSTSNVYMYDGNPYKWNDTDFFVDDEELPNVRNLLTQEMMSDANTIYIIRYDYTLKEDITLPDGCVLEFDGGSISGAHTITLQNTLINGKADFGSDVEFDGTCANKEIDDSWFSDDDVLLSFMNNVTGFEKVQLSDKTYQFTAPINPLSSCEIEGNGATIKRADATQAGSLCVMECTHQIEKLTIKNITFDGGYVGTVEDNNSIVVSKGVYIHSCSHLVIKNVNIVNFYLKMWVDSEHNTHYDHGLLTALDYDLIEVDNLYMNNNANDGEGIIFSPAIETLYSPTDESRAIAAALTCKVVFENSNIGSNIWWTTLMAWGNLVYRNNVTGKNSGTLNAFVNTAVIEHNIFNNFIRSYAIDFVEDSSNPYNICKNAVISDNIFNNASSALLNCAQCKNIEVRNNRYTKDSDYEGAERFIEMAGAENIVIEDNYFDGVKNFTSTDAPTPNPLNSLVLRNNVINNIVTYTAALFKFYYNVKNLTLEGNTILNGNARRKEVFLFGLCSSLENIYVRNNICKGCLVDTIYEANTAPVIKNFYIEDNIGALPSNLFADTANSQYIYIKNNNFNVVVTIHTNQYEFTRKTLASIKADGGAMLAIGNVVDKKVVIYGECGYDYHSVGDSFSVARGSLFVVEGVGVFFTLTDGTIDTTDIASVDLRTITTFSGVKIYKTFGHSYSRTVATFHPLGIPSGTFANKPSKNDIYVGYGYFCTDKQTTEGATNGIEIYHKGNNVWVDALGRTIS